MIEIFFSVAFLILILSFFFQALGLSFTLANGKIAAGFFPTITTIILIVLILYHIITLIKNKKKIKSNNNEDVYEKDVVQKQLYIVVALGLALVIVKFLGMIPTLGLFLLMSLVIVEKMSWIKSAIF